MKVGISGILETAERLFSYGEVRNQKKGKTKYHTDEIHINEVLRDKVTNIGENIKNIEDEINLLQYRKKGLLMVLDNVSNKDYDKDKILSFLQEIEYNGNLLLDEELLFIKKAENKDSIIKYIQKRIGEIDEKLGDKKKAIYREYSALENIFSVALFNEYKDVVETLKMLKKSIKDIPINVKPEVVKKLIGG
jgi:hypothetical protein